MISNRKASYNYFLEKGYNAGLKLLGPEVKALRNNHGSFIQGAFCFFDEDGNLNLRGLNIIKDRDIRLLLNKKELDKLFKSKTKGYTIIPTKVFIRNGHFKVEIYLAKGKKEYDKRESLKKKEHERCICRGNSY